MPIAEYVHIPAGLLLYVALDAVFIAKCALFVALLLAGSIASGKICNWFLGLPVIAGQIIGGIILGPTGLHIASFSLFSHPVVLTDSATGMVYTVPAADLSILFCLVISAIITVPYLLWLAGHETDMRDIRSIGFAAGIAGLFGALLPIIMTAGVLYSGIGYPWDLTGSIGMGLVFAATSVSISVAMLFAYEKMHLRSSKVTLGAAVIDDILAVIFLSVFTASIASGIFLSGHEAYFFEHEGSHYSSLTMTIISLIGALVLLLVTGYYGLRLFPKWLKKKQASHLIAPVSIICMLLFFSGSELLGGLAGITGAYFAGLFHRLGDASHQAEKTIAPFVHAILLPIFLGSIGLQINMRILYFSDWLLVGLLLIIAIISKMLGCWLAMVIDNAINKSKKKAWTNMEAYLFGSSMVARGEVGIIVATLLFGSRIFSYNQYVIAIVVTILTTIVTPIMLALGFKRFSTHEQLPRDRVDDFHLGVFSVVGSERMFNIIVETLTKISGGQTVVTISEGRKIVNVENENMRLVLSPEDGILLEGEQKKIEELVRQVKHVIAQDIEKLSL